MIELKVTGLEGVLDLLKSLPAEVVSKNGGPVRAALRKGALVIRNQEKANLLAITAQDQFSTGLLYDNIIASRGRMPPGVKGEKFVIRVKRKVYPRPNNEGGNTSTWKTARLLEYGSSKQTAQPFIRPAASSKAQEAVNVTTAELVKRLNAIVRKLSK